MVSIMPGMENLAPERTDTSSGSAVEPSCLPVTASSPARAVMIWSMNSLGRLRLFW